MPKKFTVSLKQSDVVFYEELAKVSDRPVEEILADALHRTAEIISEETREVNG